MHTIEEIQRAVGRLSAADRETVMFWLQDLLQHGEDEEDRIEEPQSAYRLDSTPHLTLEEYDQLEENSPVRHEYINGVLYAMSGASIAHNCLAGNLFAAFHAHLRGSPCKAFTADQQLHMKSGADEIIYYPDVMIACQRDQWTRNKVRNPKLVVEVLSPSTREIDRREKSLNYRRTPSIEEYVIAAQDAPELAIHRRKERWQREVVAGSDAIIEFCSIGLALPLARIYEDVFDSNVG
ncbi:MAG: Uma2 family endonuclease [Steroidobacteraceae bacterium]